VTEDQLYDLAVVGGGPAGSLAAYLAAEAGFSSVIIEKDSFPRGKICGGFISARALSLLPAPLKVSVDSATPVSRIEVIKSKNQYSFETNKLLGLLVKRSEFDHFLLMEAVKQGAKLAEQCPLQKIKRMNSRSGYPFYRVITGKNKMQTLAARYVIGADGALGKTAHLAGLHSAQTRRQGRAVAASGCDSDTNIAPGTLIFFPLPFSGGMGWSFQGNGWYNRGVGGLQKRQGLLRHYARLFPAGETDSGVLSWPLPYLGPLKKTSCDNLLLIGDAAGLIEPFSGEGLYNAFLSARLAVDSISEAEERQVPAGEIYHLNFRKYFRKKFFRVLTGAVMLHARAILAPSTLPEAMATLMENNLWFNR